MANSRMSMYSVLSDGVAGRGGGSQPNQVSATTLLNTIHNIYLSSQPYRLDASTSLVVNTWLTAMQPGPDGRVGGVIDDTLAARAWEHARRRAEDGCVVLGSLHPSTPSLLAPFLSSLPVSFPGSLFKALEAINPFLRCVTPRNPSAPRQVALGVSLTLNLAGNITAATVALSGGGIDTEKGLLKIPADAGYRAFDVFYYLLTSASTPAEREFLGLKNASSYSLLSRSGTYDPPSYLPTADDGVAADDFRTALKEIGIKGAAHRDLISTLAGLLKLGDTLDYQVDEEDLDEICEDVSGLLGMEPELLARQCTTEDRGIFIAGLYEALVDWVITKANEAIALQLLRIRDGDESSDGGRGARTPNSNEDTGDTVCLTVLEVPDPALGRAIAMRGIFDDSTGINAEMKQDGIDLAPAGSSVVREMQGAVAEQGPDLGIMVGSVGRDRQRALEKREEVLEKMALSADEGGFLRKVLFPVEAEGISLGQHARLDLAALMSASRVWYHLSIHPTDESPAGLAALPSITSAWSAGTVSRQIRSWRLPEWANRRNKNLDYTADFDLDEFVQRYRVLGCPDGKDGIEGWIMERGWSNGEVIIGEERVWMRENAWWEAESMLDLKPMGAAMPGLGNQNPAAFANPMAAAPAPGAESGYSANGSEYFQAPLLGSTFNDSHDQLVYHQRNMSQPTLRTSPLPAPSVAPTGTRADRRGDYGLGVKGDNNKYRDHLDDLDLYGDEELASGKTIERQTMTPGRKAWVAFVWALTFWIPSPLLRYVGRMKRPDVRMAWREKVVLCFLIVLANAFVVFWIVAFGHILCPNSNKAWNSKEVGYHTGDNDFWVSIHGKVYDVTKFWKLQHSDTSIKTSTSNMQPFAGMNLDEYFVAPLPLSCPGLGIAETTQLTANSTPVYPNGVHTSGYFQPDTTSALRSASWYKTNFLPKIKEYYHGDLVWKKSKVKDDGENNNHQWVIYDGGVYDLTDYFHTLDLENNLDTYKFLDSDITDAIKDNPGQDITDTWNSIVEKAVGNSSATANVENSLNCIKNAFYIGKVDFRDSARCQANNYILLAFTVVICAVILVKFLSALQFGGKRMPAPQDKFVICQVPAYTEDEDALRKALDSLTTLQYDNKRKLICVICDGVIVGAGNDRPTPKIVLDILGVDPKTDPAALPFRSVGMGNEQLNYAKVYSGLYDHDGNVVPYLVVVKVGKESEQSSSKPGNRGKRDSQILVMNFLNRVHHRAPMCPLELEMFHQINNIIGVDPELYEYVLMVDADTSVREDSLNRLVSACANDAKIAGICGETSLQNEDRSWWTMIQVYEYYISHHMAKAFESLFGSVTCLPGCFSMYRLRTADKGKPLIISDAVIKEYSDCNVDTLHKKNLLSLGEDRFLTTLMSKHFPYMSYKFVQDAYCQTAAPDKMSILLSQRRRWINSTIHNLVELMWLKEMCGFCCFSMRFVVMIDLAGTIILPSTCVLLAYIIYEAASNNGQFPYISIAMLAGVYGLQAVIFILKRQWQHVGWMIIYLLATPIYSVILPIYSFWNQDNFSWGNTRIVLEEKGSKKVIAVDGEGFDPRSIPLQTWDEYALANNLPGRRGTNQEKFGQENGVYYENYELDDMKSVYSSVRQASVLTGLHGHGAGAYMPPQSPAPFAGASPYGDAGHIRGQSMASMGGYAETQRVHSPFPNLSSSAAAAAAAAHHRHSTATLGPVSISPGLGASASTTPPSGMLGGGGRESARMSAVSLDFAAGRPGALDDAAITEAIQAVLREVDLDTVTKKQVRALVERRLQTELVGERRTFMDRQIDAELASM